MQTICFQAPTENITTHHSLQTEASSISKSFIRLAESFVHFTIFYWLAFLLTALLGGSTDFRTKKHHFLSRIFF